MDLARASLCSGAALTCLWNIFHRLDPVLDDTLTAQRWTLSRHLNVRGTGFCSIKRNLHPIKFFNFTFLFGQAGLGVDVPFRISGGNAQAKTPSFHYGLRF